MQLQVSDALTSSLGGPVSVRCPICRQIGTFDAMGSDLSFTSEGVTMSVGHRVCPNPPCKGHVFVVLGPGHRLLESYPPELVDFDTSGIPSEIVESFEESIKCHANQCFVASAIMARKTLELLCAAQKVSGANLKEKIAALGSKVVLPPELFAGLDDLRLLGNDAVHTESTAYKQVSQEEVEVVMELTKEVLKAVYQYRDL